MFHRLSYEYQLEIAEKFLSREIEFLAARGHKLELDKSALPFLVRKGFHPKLGALTKSISCFATLCAGRGWPVFLPFPRQTCGWKIVSSALRQVRGSTLPSRISVAPRFCHGLSPGALHGCLICHAGRRFPTTAAVNDAGAVPASGAISNNAPLPPPAPVPDLRISYRRKMQNKFFPSSPPARKSRVSGGTAGRSGRCLAYSKACSQVLHFFKSSAIVANCSSAASRSAVMSVAMWRPLEIYLYEWWPLKLHGRVL